MSGSVVYVPREARRGLMVDDSSKVSSKELLDYADKSMDVAAGLGEEVEVIGMSGSSSRR